MKVSVISALAAAVSIACASIGSAAIVIDGTADAAYGPALAVQTISTGYGNAAGGNTATANGSEVDQAFGKVEGGVLYLTIAGNVESNFNKLTLFIDSVAGGQNTVQNANNSFGAMSGLTFDNGFAADYALTLGGGGTPYTVYVNNATLTTAGGFSEGYLGSSGAVTDGTLSGGTNPNGIKATINNNNGAGVGGGNGADSGAGVTTGVEFAIPLAAIGSPTGPISISAFIADSGNNGISNQVLGGLPAGTNNLGSPSGVNFANITGNQFFTVVPEPTTLAAVAGMGIVALRRRK